MRVSKSLRAASRTGCLASPKRSTTAGTSALKCNLRCSPDRTAAEARAWRAPWETLKLLSLRRSKQQSTSAVTSDEVRLFLEASSSWWRRSTPAIRSFVSLARASSRASSIGASRRTELGFLRVSDPVLRGSDLAKTDGFAPNLGHNRDL